MGRSTVSCVVVCVSGVSCWFLALLLVRRSMCGRVPRTFGRAAPRWPLGRAAAAGTHAWQHAWLANCFWAGRPAPCCCDMQHQPMSAPRPPHRIDAANACCCVGMCCGRLATSPQRPRAFVLRAAWRRGARRRLVVAHSFRAGQLAVYIMSCQNARPTAVRCAPAAAPLCRARDGRPRCMWHAHISLGLRARGAVCCCCPCTVARRHGGRASRAATPITKASTSMPGLNASLPAAKRCLCCFRRACCK